MLEEMIDLIKDILDAVEDLGRWANNGYVTDKIWWARGSLENLEKEIKGKTEEEE